MRRSRQDCSARSRSNQPASCIRRLVHFQPAAGTIALDGEREIEVKTSHQVSIALSPDGPWTIDIDRAIATAAAGGKFLSTNTRS